VDLAQQSVEDEHRNDDRLDIKSPAGRANLLKDLATSPYLVAGGK
jgi:hypothetical protein